MTSIGSYAFYDCSKLTSVTIGNSVTSIGDEAFRDCSSLTSVTIPDSVTSIGGSAFHGCSSLTSFNVSTNNRYYSASDDGKILYNKDKTRLIAYPSATGDVAIPDSVTSIGGSAFSGCSSLTSVTIPDSVTSIGYQAFSGCSNLESVTIPDSVTSIGDYAFSWCSGLTSVAIPDSVTSIGESAFSWCRSLESVVIPDSVTSIGDSAFEYCSNLESVTIPDSVTSIGDSAFQYCSNLESVYITDLEAWCNIKFSSSSANPLDHGANLYLNGSLVKDLVIPDSVTSIDNYAFSGCSSLESVVIGDSVTYIYGSAFSGCSSLTNLRVDTNNPNYSSSDDGKILYNKDKTKLIAYPSATGDVTIPDSVTSIGDYAFRDLSSLTSVAIPDSVTSIGGSAFSDCSKLTSVTFKDTNNWYYTNNSDYTDGTAVDVTDKAQNATYLKSTYYNKYWYKYSETTVTVTADNVTDAISKLSTGGNHTVKVTGAITSDTISSIKTALKNNSNAYVNLDLSDTTGLTSIDYHAFLYCSSLTSIVIPNSVTSIDSSTFYGCSSLTNIVIPDSVTYIGSSAFLGCSSLTSVTIPDSVTYIYGETFYNCDSLTTVNYKGTQEQWEQISIYYGNEDLKSATINYNYTGE